MSATVLITELVLDVIRRVRGDSSDDAAKVVAKAVAATVIEAVLPLVTAELEKHQAALGMVLATRDLADAADACLKAIREAELVTPVLIVEEMPANWTPPKDGDP